nr:reverse transcriptase domain-containing protein [Tanacetum cinerariifolium]
MPSFKKELKVCEAKTGKSSVDEPPKVELKDLPPHLEYAFLEGDNKLPVIIAKELGDEEKSVLIKVLKSHKQAIAWKLSDIQGINPEFCTHKILMEEDYKPAVQHQRRVNPKIYDVIKKEVEKLLDAGLIYPISDSPWVSPVHCVPKKGGFTVVDNEENELIPTRLVIGWRASPRFPFLIMSFITAQQAKLDLELVPKEKRLKGQDFDALPTDEEVVSFLRELRHIKEINSLNDVVVDHMYQPNKIEMHTSRDDYLINTLRFVSTKEETQIYGAILPECLTSPAMKEIQAYQTYLGFATGATPSKKAQKFEKPASPKLTTIPVSTETPTRKSKRVKRPAKKSIKTPARCVFITKTPKMPLTKKKEKVDVTCGKGIELLSQVALTKDAQFKEVRKKSMRDFHRTHPSGSGTVTKTALSVAKIKPFATNDSNNEQVSGDEDVDQEKDSDDENPQLDNELKSDSEHETNESDLGLESDHDESEENKEDDDEDDETKITNNFEGDKDEVMDYTTSQLYDDEDIRLKEPVDNDEWFVQEEGNDAAMTNV